MSTRIHLDSIPAKSNPGQETEGPGPSRPMAALALCLLAPAPSIGVLVGLTFNEGTLGTALWVAAKFWLFGLPLFWHLLVDKRPLSWPRLTWDGVWVGAALGVLMSLIILGLFVWAGRNAMDPALLRQKILPLGLTDPSTYLAMSAYIVFVNSGLEEYVYRWFVFRKFESLVGGRLAVFGSAAIFVIHHAIILSAYSPVWLVVSGSCGVFVGGAVWSWLFLKYQSIWPPYLSHAIVDVALMGIGYWVIAN